MTIRDEARAEAERRYPARYYQISRPAFEAGAVWASEQADREPSDAEVEAAADAIIEASFGQELPEAPVDLARAALLAAGFRKTDREASALRSHVRDLTGETDEGLTELGGFRGERHDSTETGSVAPPSDADLVSVSWFDCDCGFSKPCTESHLKRARVPRALLAAQEVRHVS